MCTTNTTVRTTLLETIAEIKVVKKGTERHVEIGTMMVVEETKDVPTSIKTPSSQEE